jgi:hypothetical protein
MSAVFEVRIRGEAGEGMGVLYLGHGVVAGVSGTGVRLDGTYSTAAGATAWTVSLTAPAGQALVTGQTFDRETTFEVTTDWSLESLEKGRPQALVLQDHRYELILEKLRDLP